MWKFKNFLTSIFARFAISWNFAKNVSKVILLSWQTTSQVLKKTTLKNNNSCTKLLEKTEFWCIFVHIIFFIKFHFDWFSLFKLNIKFD